MNRKELNDRIYNSTGGVVQQGPFAGLKMINNAGGCLGNKLLGSYESQLYPVVEEMISKQPDLVINVGCGEGYYGVGLAYRMPSIEHILVDTADHELTAAIQNGNLNQLSNVKFWDNATIDRYRSVLAQSTNPVMVVDVEGYEMTLLDPAQLPELTNATILVECHDFLGIPITKTLVTRFNQTHEIVNILEQGKDCLHECISDFTEPEKNLVLSEGRPTIMNWLYMVPKTKVQQ